MYNPLVANAENQDLDLISQALAGNPSALEDLVERHQPWIFNIAVRMTADFDLSEDVTQEILIIMITKLVTYDPAKAAFRTWLYRIVANHVIGLKRKDRAYVFPGGFPGFGRHLDEVPMEELPPEPPNSLDGSSETRLLIEEAKNGCMTLMLLCLSMQERIVYILGEIFGVSGREGAEILEMSPENFRKILSRARADLTAFMKEKCGLVNPKARCRCSGKVLPHLKTGRLKRGQLRFSRPASRKVSQVVARKVRIMNRLASDELPGLYREHPFYEPRDTAEVFKKIMNNPRYRELFS